MILRDQKVVGDGKQRKTIAKLKDSVQRVKMLCPKRAKKWLLDSEVGGTMMFLENCGVCVFTLSRTSPRIKSHLDGEVLLFLVILITCHPQSVVLSNNFDGFLSSFQ